MTKGTRNCYYIERNFLDYIFALDQAHNQMLELIQDGKNQMIILEQNPLHSQDAMFGVPPLFQEILNEIIYRAQYESDNEVHVAIMEGEEDEQIDQKSKSSLSLSAGKIENDYVHDNDSSPMLPLLDNDNIAVALDLKREKHRKILKR
jgi:hypothetical protein